VPAPYQLHTTRPDLTNRTYRENAEALPTEVRGAKERDSAERSNNSSSRALFGLCESLCRCRLGFVLALMATAITALIWRYLNLVETNSPESLSPESNFVEELSRDRRLRIYTFFLFLGLIALLALQGANNEKEASDSNRKSLNRLRRCWLHQRGQGYLKCTRING
jgi:hypothetical protein